MALIKCSECGKKFSDNAEACPHCGCPMSAQITLKPSAPKVKKTFTKRTKKKLIQFGILIGAVLVVVLIFVIINAIINHRNKIVTDELLYNNGGTKITEIFGYSSDN